MKHHCLAALLLAAAAAPAQVCVTGVVQPVGGPTICMQGETHFLADTRVYLRSATIDLNQYVGQLVHVTGTDIGVTCRVLDVALVQPPPAQLRVCGTPMPGCALQLRVAPGAIGRYAIAASFGPGYQPLGCAPLGWLDGTLLLQPPAITLVLAMFPGPTGDYVWQIPNQPGLAGIQIWFQGARQDVGPVGPVQLTNVLRVQLTPFMPPCGGINC